MVSFQLIRNFLKGDNLVLLYKLIISHPYRFYHILPFLHILAQVVHILLYYICHASIQIYILVHTGDFYCVPLVVVIVHQKQALFLCNFFEDWEIIPGSIFGDSILWLIKVPTVRGPPSGSRERQLAPWLSFSNLNSFKIQFPLSQCRPYSKSSAYFDMPFYFSEYL